MATNMRRFTISVPDDVDRELDALKKELYYRNTQTEMIRDLIIRGLKDLKAEKCSS